jgi:hypothetical protein
MHGIDLPELLVICGILFLLGFTTFLFAVARRWKR